MSHIPHNNSKRHHPLSGVRALVTRPRAQAQKLRDRLVDLGAEVMVQAAIEIAPPDDWARVDDALSRLDEFDWLVFSSTNGVSFLLERLVELNRDEDDRADPQQPLELIPTSLKLAAIGPGTAEELQKFQLHADFVPREYRAEALAEGLASDARGQRFLLARASRGRQVLCERLTTAGAAVEEVVVYESRDISPQNPGIIKVAADLAAGRIDWVTVTSSAIARSIARLYGDKLHHAKLASISPITSSVLRELGHEPAVEADEYTMEGVVRAILRYEA